MNSKEINYIPEAKKKVSRFHFADTDVDLTTLINCKSAYQEVKEKLTNRDWTRYELFAVMFAMYCLGVTSGMGYVNGIRTGNKFIMSIEAASGVMFIIALTFMVAFIAALTAKVKRW